MNFLNLLKRDKYLFVDDISNHNEELNEIVSKSSFLVIGGVGGHCIAVDPYFIISDYPMKSKIISTARELNNYKSFWCLEKIQNEKLKFEFKHGRKPITALMGLAFKSNIDDLRESPAKYIVQKVLQNSNNETHYIVEPNIESHSVYKLTDYKEAIAKADIIVFLVSHNEFKNLAISNEKIKLGFCRINKYN